MSNKIQKEIESFMSPERERKANWAGFVESDVVAFFNAHGLEKISIEDGHGNKAKLVRQRDEGIKVEYSTKVIL